MRVGTDIAEVERVRDAIMRTGDAFIKRIYTEQEVAYCEARGKHRFESYAARFAAKEAFAKALGTGISADVEFSMIEVVSDEAGKPHIRLSGATEAFFTSHYPHWRIDVSLAHTSELATATIIIYKE